MEKSRFSVWLPLFLSISVVTGMILGYKMRDGMPGKSFFYRDQGNKIREIVKLINDNYVDKLPEDALYDTAIQAMLGKLDPHSVYIPAEELERVNDEIAGGFFGIGVEFNIFEDTVHVINVLKDGPGSRAGLKSGDRIIQAGDSIMTGKSLVSDEVRKILRGKQGTIVVVKVVRGKDVKTIEIVRGMVPLSSVDAAYMIDKEIGYIRLNKFSQLTYREFMESLDDLKGQEMKKLILDLRDNGGGVLDEAVEIADEFLDQDKLITYTEGRHISRRDYRCRRNGQFEQGALAILINESTASASEIIAGALQDWGRATVLGRRSFGKGLVQEQFDLSDASALRLTVARYFTPLGRSIQRSYANGGKAYYEEYAGRFGGEEYFNADSVKIDSSQKFIAPGGKVLYGGGGIHPDVFVAGDTGRMGNFTSELYLRGTISDFGYRYLIAHSEIQTKFKTPESFFSDFSMNEADWTFFESQALKDSITSKISGSEEKKYIESVLKRSIARQIWRNEGYFRLVNKDDKVVTRAIALLKN